MEMSVEEQIVSLEEQIANTKGPGSKERKQALQKQIDSLKESQSAAEKPSGPAESPKERISRAEQNMPATDQVPLPTKWEPVTIEQVLAAERDGTLCGFDNEKMLALIRK